MGSTFVSQYLVRALVRILDMGRGLTSGIPEFRSFGQKGKFSAFGFRFRPPKVKAEYGRNSRKALDFFFPSVFQDGLVFLIHFWQLIFASTLTFEIVHY